MSNFFSDEFILCFNNKITNSWRCEEGYMNIKEIEKQIDLLPTSYDRVTTIVPIKKWYPNVLRYIITINQLKPKITFMYKHSK